MKTNDIKEIFDLTAKEYDSQRRKFIPCFDDYYATTIDFVHETIQKPSTIVDLGAGTGLLSKYLYDYYPDAKYTLIDVSDKMLEIAKQRFEGLNNFDYKVIDYTKEFDDCSYDLVSSALSIHHLENKDKLKLYKNIYNHLSKKGTFLNIDQFNANTKKMNSCYEQWWTKYIKNSGIAKEEYEKWLKRRELDKENTIDETKELLKEAGFEIIECIYKFMKFGVVLAMKNN
jgi:tRNA (cmo5U34)-methyltransferase